MIVLGIETSCDETGVAIYSSEYNLAAHKLYSQISLHSKYGGVIPELASRDHSRKLLHLTDDLLNTVNISLRDISAIAYTAGPGLIGSLLVGASFAVALGFALNVPTIPIHHLEAHIMTPFLEKKFPSFPFLALLVSGGNTQIIEAMSFGKYRILGETLDDAVGEAFDKVAKILGFSYPGGVHIEKLAKKGNQKRFFFPRPMLHRGLNFSYSGLKTCALDYVKKFSNIDNQTKADIAFAFQEAAIDSLVIKCQRALNKYKYYNLVVTGGVSANGRLREKLIAMCDKEQINVYFPKLEFCTDNALMVAYTGYKKFKEKQTIINSNHEIIVFPKWNINDINKKFNHK